MKVKNKYYPGVLGTLLFLICLPDTNCLRHGHVVSSQSEPLLIDLDQPESLGRSKRDLSLTATPVTTVLPSTGYFVKNGSDSTNESVATTGEHNRTVSVIFDRDYALNNSMITLVHLNDSHEQLTGKMFVVMFCLLFSN